MKEQNLLEHIQSPQDVKALGERELQTLCGEIRETLIQTVSETGGHLASNLGVVELTVALHREMNCPDDSIVWDVGHQCYTHKLLTGRYGRFHTLRQHGGISGFPNPKECDCDAFVAGHSSTAVSAASGQARANTLLHNRHYAVAVIGDGAMTGGLAYEGLNSAGHSGDRLIVILNDNRMSISRNVGFVARHLATLRSRTHYIRFKRRVSAVLEHLPLIGKPLYRLILRIKLNMKYALYDSSTMFEDMGFYYFGPIDGHNLHDLSEALKAAKAVEKPVLLHVETVKGKGYAYAVRRPDRYHGVGGFDIDSGETLSGGDSFSSVFGEEMTRLAAEDPRIFALTAAMKDGTGLSRFAELFPERFADVGIAEEHAVTFSSGMATKGMLPVFAVYSTFLQRCYDQILNDTAIMNNHIVLAIDRAGIVPDDGTTHQGLFDVAFLQTIPHTTVYAPSGFAELRQCLTQALYHTEGIAAVRYPKGGESDGAGDTAADYAPYRFEEDPGADMLLITYGRLYGEVCRAVRQLRERGTRVSVLKLTRVCPIDPVCVTRAGAYRRVIFAEEGTRCGGVGEHFGSLLLQQGLTPDYTVRAVDGFIPTCKTAEGLQLAGLDAESLVRLVSGEEVRTETENDYA